MNEPLSPIQISRRLEEDLRGVRFGEPITHTYQPLRYAWEPHVEYLRRFAERRPREVLVVGMNPGPWGMAQVGVPFGAISMVRDWMGIEAPVGEPEEMHPKRVVEGFSCSREEVSGSRLWGWVRDRFGDPENFFERFFVHNYCPLMMLEESGRNRTPPKLKKEELQQVLPPCDRALISLVEYFQPTYVVGVGAYAEKRLKAALAQVPQVQIGRILHPSPASPKANRGWAPQAEAELQALGIELP